MAPAASRPAGDRRYAETGRRRAYFCGRALPGICTARGRRPAAWHLRRLGPDAAAGALRIACLWPRRAQCRTPARLSSSTPGCLGPRAVSPRRQETGAALSRALAQACGPFTAAGFGFSPLDQVQLAEACGPRAFRSPARRRHAARCRRVLRSYPPSCARRPRPCRQPAHMPLACLMPGARGAGARLAGPAFPPARMPWPGRAAALAPRACAGQGRTLLAPRCRRRRPGRAGAGRRVSSACPALNAQARALAVPPHCGQAAPSPLPHARPRSGTLVVPPSRGQEWAASIFLRSDVMSLCTSVS